MLSARAKHLLAVFAFLFWGAFLLITGEAGLSRQFQVMLTTVTWIVVIAYIATCMREKGAVLPLVYIVFLGLFHLGLVVPVYIGIEPEKWLRWLGSDYLSSALNLCALAFAIFASGVGLAMVHRQNHSRNVPNNRGSQGLPIKTQTSTLLLLTGIAVQLVGLVMLAFGIIQLGIFAIPYGESYLVRLESDPRLFGVGYSVALAGIVIAAASASNRQIGYVALFGSLALSPLFFYGFRGHIIVYMICLLIIWYRKDPARAVKVGTIAVILVILINPAVKEARQPYGSLRSALASLSLSPLYLLMEMGGSLYPFVATLQEMAASGENPYWYGRSYLMALRRVVPNISLSWQSPERFEDLAPGAWITNQVSPWVFKRGGGIGYSGVAEPYLNFGVPGIIGFFLILGYVLARVDTVVTQKHDLYVTAAVMCAFAALLWTTRNSFTNFVRPATWPLVVIYGVKLLTSRRLTQSTHDQTIIS